MVDVNEIPYPTKLVQQIPTKPSVLAIVGEAPGVEEMRTGRPFCGPEGMYATVLWNKGGLKRDTVYMTNTVHVQPEKNDYNKLLPYDRECGKNQLIRDLTEWKALGLKTIIATGQHALELLTGKTGILKYRGTELACTLVPGLKVCASIHPGYILKGNGKMEPIFVADIVKFMKRIDSNEVYYPYRDITIMNDMRDTVSMLDQITDREKPVMVDIETMGPRMTVWGVGVSRSKAYVIPRDFLTSPMILKGISRFARSSTPKCFHNALFDAFHGPYYYKIFYRNIFCDTMLKQHACYPTLPKSLAFCASLYTNEPYWKDEGSATMLQLAKEGHKGEDLWKRLYIYNGKDNCLQYEVMEEQEAEIESWGVKDVYARYMALIEPCLWAMLKGMLTYPEAIKIFSDKNEKAIVNLEKLVQGTMGSINVRSSQQVQKLVYDQWGFKKQFKQGAVTADELALKRLSILPTPYQSRLDLIRTTKEHLKLRDFYNIKFCPDGHVRYSLKIHGAYTGRMSSSASIVGSGTNYQNQPEVVRHFYIPEKGRIFVQADLSQSEARIVAALCGDIDWLKGFDERDIHSEVAAALFNIPIDKVDKSKNPNSHRQIGKKVSHGTHYKMGPYQLADHVECSYRDAVALSANYHKLRPALKVWQDSVCRNVREKRMIRTIFGHVMQFMGPITDATYREAIAGEPQSTSAYYMNDGIIKCWNEIPDYDFRLQVHDSMLFSGPDDLEWLLKTIPLVKKLTEQTITINGISFVIPLEFEIGYSWGEFEKIKAIDKIDEAYAKLQKARNVLRQVS